jgi:hypothetical protein
MRTEARIFYILTVFFFVLAIIYGVLAKEPVGITAITLSGGLTLIIGTYFGFVARRVQIRPEDDPKAEISDGAGDLGFFSPGSGWPIALAGATAITALGLSFFAIWLIAVGVVAILGSVAGLVFEYHTPPDHD